MEKKEIIYDFSHLAPGFQLYFLSDCPRHEDCLRYLAGQGTYYRYHHGEKKLTPEQQE